MNTRKHYANALRALAMDAVDKANSGHPGAPLGMANIAESLWRGFYKHNPKNPKWINKDRFILSNGHASMLLYGLLHLTGYDLPMSELKSFRQFSSKTPGHPELHTPGVDVGTGPLGQGLAAAVGMALAEKVLGTTFNRPSFNIVDHNTWVFLGEGCLMEGISQEAISLAGTLGLGKLTVLFDSNDISIDGPVKNWFSEDVPMRFEACHWHVVRNVDGHDSESIDNAIKLALSVTDKPSLIVCKTVIGYGSPAKAGSASCHGAPLGLEESIATKAALGWEYAPFEIPQDVYDAWDARKQGEQVEMEWNNLYMDYREEYPDLAIEFERRVYGNLPDAYYKNVDKYIAQCLTETKPITTRVASQNFLNALVPSLPELIGGSGDLSKSVLTIHDHAVAITHDNFAGNYIYYGVREFAMGAIMNGMTLHGGFIPYGGTFLVFSDYVKAALRLGALSHIRTLWVLPHDSIGVGEDGPTHQPVEQMSTLRMTPGVDLWRPCDTVETAVAWKYAIERTDGPSCFALSRQNLAAQNHENNVKDISKGGYIFMDCEGKPELIYIATGSEVELASQSARLLIQKGRRIRVVSMPCTDVFERQSEEYRNTVLPPEVRKRIAVEAGIPDFWYKYVGLDGMVIGMSTYGESAPANILFPRYGFTVENLVESAKTLLGA